MTNFIEKKKSDAPMGMITMFIASSNWAQMTQEQGLYKIVTMAIITSIVCNFLAQLLLTRRLKLTLIHSISNALIVLSLTTMFTIFGWNIGINETAAFVVNVWMASLVPAILTFELNAQLKGPNSKEMFLLIDPLVDAKIKSKNPNDFNCN